jgi:hypothetical protein
LDIRTLLGLVFQGSHVIRKTHLRSFHSHFLMCGLSLNFGMCHLIFVVACCILSALRICALCLSCIPLFSFLFFYFAFNFCDSIVVFFKIWQHFMLLVIQTTPSWWTNQGQSLFLNTIWHYVFFATRFFTCILGFI